MSANQEIQSAAHHLVLPRRGASITRRFRSADGVVYDLARAKQAHGKIAEMDVMNLGEPVKVEVPFTGIGAPPSRPGGDLVAVGRGILESLYDLFMDVQQAKSPGSRIYVSGPIGSGKTVLLRQLAVFLVKDSGCVRIVCIWNTEAVLLNFLREIKSAFCFTYAVHEEILESIGKFESLADVEQFMDERIKMKEEFCFIVDGGEVFDPRADLRDPDRAQVLNSFDNLVNKSLVSVICLSPMADRWSRKRKAESDWFNVSNGFFKLECEVYLDQLSLLGSVVQMQDSKRRVQDVKYYAGSHPLSLAILNNCCWLLARRRRLADTAEGASRRMEAVVAFKRTNLQLTKEEVLWELKEDEDWEEVLQLYVSCEELTRVRLLAQEAAAKEGSGACHTATSMMKLDLRFVYGDPDLDFDEPPCYVNKYIERVYVEEMRNAERKRLYQGGAWAPYCKHLLENATTVNWSEMGWLCENFVAEVISLKGLQVEDGLKISEAQVRRFGTVPQYDSWVTGVKDGRVLFFLPLKYNYGSVDGVLVLQTGGKLHFIAIQVTVNDAAHRHSALEFMAWETITKWIPEEVRSEWVLHYMFLCLRDESAKDVQENLKPLRSGGYYGTVGYRLHVVSFGSAFHGLLSDDVRHTLHVIAAKRDSVNPAPAVAAPQGNQGTGSSTLGSTVAQVLEWNVFSRDMLRAIAKFQKVEFSQKDTKAELKTKIVEQVASSSL